MSALNKGLAIAGREKGLSGTDEEVAVESAAQIAADMIRAGRGDDVLKLYAVVAPKADDGDDAGEGSALERALNRLPGAGNSPAASLTGHNQDETADDSIGCDDRATDSQSVARQTTPPGEGGQLVDRAPGQPFFGGPLNLPFAERVDDEPARQAGQGAGGATPHPPRGPSQTPIHLRTENFEKTGAPVGGGL